MILSLFTRLDGKAYSYALTRPGVDVERHRARNLYPTKGESFHGEQAALEWELVRSWFVPEGFGKTVRDAMGRVGVK